MFDDINPKCATIDVLLKEIEKTLPYLNRDDKISYMVKYQELSRIKYEKTKQSQDNKV